MIIYVDIDNTICFYEKEKEYHLAKPYEERITKINKLFDEGHEIHYWTARGSVSGKNWFMLTFKQLESWNCKYNSLKLGKPNYDLFIDDKNINSEDYFK